MTSVGLVRERRIIPHDAIEMSSGESTVKSSGMFLALCAAALVSLPLESRSSTYERLPAVASLSCEEDDCELVASYQIGRDVCVRVTYESDIRGVPTDVGASDPDWYVAPLKAGRGCGRANYSFVPRDALNQVVRAVEVLMDAVPESVELEGRLDANDLRCALAKSRSGFLRLSVNRHEPGADATMIEVDACARHLVFVVSPGTGPKIRLREAVPVVFP